MKLTPDSQRLLNFVNTNIKIPKNVLNNKSRAFLSTLLTKMKQYDKHWESKIKEYVPEQNQNLDEIIPQNIRNDLITKYQNQFSFYLPIGKRKFFINLFFRNDIYKHECMNYCKRVIHQIYLWLSVANYYASEDVAMVLKIYIYFTDHKKVLPSSDKVLDVLHVNSAFTYACKRDSSITLFRQEEWFKVFIHETFHCMGLDFACMNTHELDQRMYELFKLKQDDLRVYEAYTENWAEIINVLFISYLSTRDKTNGDLLLQKTEIMLNNERKFSLYQLCKVLHHNKMFYQDLFSTSEVSINRKRNYKENTYVLSYYLIKAIFIFNMNDFLLWTKQNNKNIEFVKTDENLRSLATFIENKYKNSNFVEFMKTIANNNFDYSNTTMRMSLHEI